MNKFHIYMIGAGGVASYLLPVLLKTFKPTQLTIIDKDVLEERNLDRQLFEPMLVGSNKAEALVTTVIPRGSLEVSVIQDWFSLTTEVPSDIDLIICVADNHMARRDAMTAALNLGVNCYIGGNEYVDSQAWAFRPEFADTPKDPRVRYPAILTSDEGSPIRCTGEAQEASPQLAMANFHCAAKILHLMWVWERFYKENRLHLDAQAIDSLPVELFTSLTSNTAS
jgi:molybdopterin/thiamine biosynthesis adenylyltransferase